MCKCKNIEIVTYDNQVVLDPPEHMKEYTNNRVKAGLSPKICVDACLESEIKQLWDLGIKTNGCCCGHNKLIPFIGVFEEDIDKMLQMGYVTQTNPTNLERYDSFYPKTIKINMDGLEQNWEKIMPNYSRHLILMKVHLTCIDNYLESQNQKRIKRNQLVINMNVQNVETNLHSERNLT